MTGFGYSLLEQVPGPTFGLPPASDIAGVTAVFMAAIFAFEGIPEVPRVGC